MAEDGKRVLIGPFGLYGVIYWRAHSIAPYIQFRSISAKKEGKTATREARKSLCKTHFGVADEETIGSEEYLDGS